MLHGTSLRLRSEYFHLPTKSHSPSAYISNLRCFVRRKQLVWARIATLQLTNLHPDLSSCSHASVRQNRIEFFLQHPYRGSYLVLYKSDNAFTLELDRNMSHVCVDRLKPANMLSYFNIAALEPNALSHLTRMLLLPIVLFFPYTIHLRF